MAERYRRSMSVPGPNSASNATDSKEVLVRSSASREVNQPSSIVDEWDAGLAQLQSVHGPDLSSNVMDSREELLRRPSSSSSAAREGIFTLGPDSERKFQDLMNDSVHRSKWVIKPYFEVTRVRRLYNAHMYNSYIQQRSKIESKRPPSLGFDIDSKADWMDLKTGANEFYLLHGTNRQNAESILSRGGFDRRRANPLGLFNKGIYFAENADEADKYSQSNTVILARVTLGRAYLESKLLSCIVPARVIMNGPNRAFDSLIAVSKWKSQLGKLARNQEFVIYDHWQCFPEYLIEYRHRSKRPMVQEI